MQHGFGRNLSLNVAYVGTHGADLRGTENINQPALGVKNGKAAPSTAAEQARSPFTTNCPVSAPGGTGAGGSCFPYLGQVNLQAPNEISTTTLQTPLHERLSHGLEFLRRAIRLRMPWTRPPGSRTRPIRIWKTHSTQGWTMATPPSMRRQHFTFTGTPYKYPRPQGAGTDAGGMAG